MTHSDSIWIYSIEQHLDSCTDRIDSLQVRLDALYSKIELYTEVIEAANDGVSNQLSAASWLLGLLGILITVVGVVIGYYIGRKKREIDQIEKTLEDKKKEVDKIAITTEELDRKINNDIEGLYKRLRLEETNTILNRLVQEPLDISNLVQLLLARDLDKESFRKLREAFLKLKEERAIGEQDNTDSTYEIQYILLFFQHYCNESLKDDDIRPVLLKYLHSACDSAFKRDIIKSTQDLCAALSDSASTFNKEDVLVEYLKAINESKHKELEEVRNILEQNLTPNTLLEIAKERCTKDKVYLKLFGIKPPENLENKAEDK